MAHYHWSELFPPHIWQRGRNYYQDGHVLEIRHRGNHITTEVEGAGVYTVSITLDPGTSRIEDHSCDCPYGEDGTPCKHLAALLCALEDADCTTAEKEKSSSIETIVCLLPENQMRQLLTQLAQNDTMVWEKILLTATNQLPKNQKQQWEQDLEQLTDEAADRHGFIDYEEAYDYCCSLQEYLYNRVPDLLHSDLAMDAFELVCMVFQTGTEQDMDDSDGGLMEPYESVLKKEFPERCVRMYECHLQQAMHQASTRKAYWSVIQTLKRLKKYPDGKAAAQKITEQWKRQYPRRTSMLDELKKQGFSVNILRELHFCR